MKSIIKEWQNEIFDKAHEVDPHNEFTWAALAIGFFIGKGKSIAQAKELLTEVEELRII
jgi:lipoprotein NlpI